MIEENWENANLYDSLPEEKSIFKFHKNAQAEFRFSHEPPNWFHQWMQWLFFGFYWEEI